MTQKENMKKFVKNNPNYFKEYMINFRKSNKKKGICIRCGKRKAKRGYVECRRCMKR